VRGVRRSAENGDDFLAKRCLHVEPSDTRGIISYYIELSLEKMLLNCIRNLQSPSLYELLESVDDWELPCYTPAPTVPTRVSVERAKKQAT